MRGSRAEARKSTPSAIKTDPFFSFNETDNTAKPQNKAPLPPWASTAHALSRRPGARQRGEASRRHLHKVALVKSLGQISPSFNNNDPIHMMGSFRPMDYYTYGCYCMFVVQKAPWDRRALMYNESL